MPVLLEVLETHKKRKHLLNSRIKMTFFLFQCFFVENHRVRRTWNNPHSFFVDEAGFNLSKGRRRGRNLIGHRATTDTPGQCGDNGVSAHIPYIGPYNTQLLLAFLNTLYRDLILEQERGLVRPHLSNYVVVWDNVSFHRTNIVRDWFAAHERITVEFLPPYSPFINPIEEFFSVWRKVCDNRPQDQMSLLGAMNAVCEDITADHCRGWRFPPRCMAMENIRCDVDGNLWPDQQEQQDVHQEYFFLLMLFCIFVFFLVTRNMKCAVIGWMDGWIDR